MLNIYLDYDYDKYPKDYISYVSDYFDNEFEDVWFEDDFVQNIIRSVDKTDVIAVDKSVVLYNDVLGTIPPQRLSSGCKGLILLYKTDIKINGDRLGDNCISLLIDISKIKDITISLSHTPPFPKKFNAFIINTGKTIFSKDAFIDENINVCYWGD